MNAAGPRPVPAGQSSGGVVPAGGVLALSARETAAALGISEWLVRRLAARGELPHYRAGGRLVFPRHALEHHLDEQARLSVS